MTVSLEQNYYNLMLHILLMKNYNGLEIEELESVTGMYTWDINMQTNWL